MRLKMALDKTLYFRSLTLLSKRDRRRLTFVLVVQMLMGLLDLIGVALMGVLGALAVNGIQSRKPGDRVTSVLTLFGLENFSLQTQSAIIGILAVTVLLGKTIFSAIFSRKMLYFLSRKSADLTYNLLSRFLSGNLLEINEQSTQRTLFALTSGVATVMVGIVGSTISFFTDLTLLLLMIGGLLVVDVRIACGSILLFGSIGLVLYFFARKRAQGLGKISTELTIKSNEKILELFTAYREIVVRNRRDYYAKIIGNSRKDLANIVAEISFLPSISKYVIETAVIVGGSILAVIQFSLLDATHAVSTLAVFMAAGTRITPALLRIQQSAITIKGSSGLSSSTLEMVLKLQNVDQIASTSDDIDRRHIGFRPEVNFSEITFRYPSATSNAIQNLSMRIEVGQKIAIVGSSGAGKTTLVDILLGIVPPDYGSVTISGSPPLDSIANWPGAIAYVPQDVTIFNGSILENICLGFPSSPDNEPIAIRALESAQLETFIENLSNGIHTQVGDRGTKLSGGQRQRLGIARALFTNPKLIVLDEATSSLDGETESNITDSILGLGGSVTVVMIAHRLATVRDADVVVYLENGKISAVGTFDEVRSKVVNFDKQAKLMGL